MPCRYGHESTLHRLDPHTDPATSLQLIAQPKSASNPTNRAAGAKTQDQAESMADAIPRSEAHMNRCAHMDICNTVILN